MTTTREEGEDRTDGRIVQGLKEVQLEGLK